MDFSYKNIYGSETYNEFVDIRRYVIDDKFLIETENYDLSDGFLLECDVYVDMEQGIDAKKITLKNADRIIYEYYCFYDHNFIFKDIIHHKNGHRYYPFHIDLYGISYLDVDTLEIYNYIPEGYPDSESFIIMDIHYDKKSNLIAYGGCYWACPYDVMVGDFSDPLNFNPYLISIRDIFNCKYNIYFKEWKDNRLYVICKDGDSKTEKSLSVDELKEKINELTERNL